MQRINFKPYQKKSGDLMLYVNYDNGQSRVSVGISETLHTSKLSKGQQNALEAAHRVFDEGAVPFTGDMKAHGEAWAETARWTLAITDVANIGGMSVEIDGLYLIKDGRILRCLGEDGGDWMDVPEKKTKCTIPC